MLTYEQIVAKVTQKAREIEACQSLIAQHTDEGNEEEAKAATEALAELVKEYDEKWAPQLEAAESHRKRIAAIQKAQKLATGEKAENHGGAVHIPNASPADVDVKDDEVGVEKSREEAFRAWLGKGMDRQRLADRDCNLLAPSAGSSAVSKDNGEGAVLPLRGLVAAMGGPAKALPVLPESKQRVYKSIVSKVPMYSVATGSAGSSTGGVQNTYVNDFREGQVNMLPMPGTPWLDRVRMVMTTSNAYEEAKLSQELGTYGRGLFGGMTFTWPGANTEGVAATATNPTFSKDTIYTHECSGLTAVSGRALSRSTVDIAAFLDQLANGGMRHEFQIKALNGTGSGEPQGVIPQLTSARKVARATASRFGATDFGKLKAKVLQDFRANAIWLIQSQAEEQLELMTDLNNRPLLQMLTGDMLPTRIKGYPFFFTLTLPDLGSEGDVIFGNPAAQTFVVEQDILVARSNERYFDQGLIAFRFDAWVGAKVWNELYLALLDDAVSS